MKVAAILVRRLSWPEQAADGPLAVDLGRGRPESRLDVVGDERVVGVAGTRKK